MKYAGKPLCNLIVVDTLATSLIVYARPCMGFFILFFLFYVLENDRYIKA